MVVVLSLAVILLASVALLLRPKPPLPEGGSPSAAAGNSIKEIDVASRLFFSLSFFFLSFLCRSGNVSRLSLPHGVGSEAVSMDHQL